MLLKNLCILYKKVLRNPFINKKHRIIFNNQGVIIMGAWYSHKCDNCSYEVQTDGPWEFYRDKNGKRKPYGHPIPCSTEAEESGIAGLSGSLYCSKCDHVSEMILVEFKKPTNEKLHVWDGRLEPEDKYKKEGAVKCPKCGNTDLLFGENNEIEFKCPRCKKGKFKSTMTMIS